MPESARKRLWETIPKVALVALGLACFLSVFLGNSPMLYAKRFENQEQGFSPFSGPQGYRSVPPQYQQWQSMPPQERDALRRRLEEYRNLPPQQQELYKQRYRQWQQIPPEDRQRIESDIQRWNELSPAQREAIRRLFNR